MRRSILRAAPAFAGVAVASDAPVIVTLATPMFGGGHAAGFVDPQQPFSPKGIRGQLRFWWRKQFLGSPECTQSRDPIRTMACREEELFGSAKIPSAFDVRLSETNMLGSVKLDSFRRFGPEAYALFSAKSDEDAPALVKEGSNFSVRFIWRSSTALTHRESLIEADNAERRKRGEVPPESVWREAELRKQLDQAVKLWLNFGGLGGRTRRGLGAVYTDDRRYLVSDEAGMRALVATISNAILYWSSTASQQPVPAWVSAISELQNFRQKGCRGPMHKKNGKDVPGRSKWPEPDSIRNISGCALQNHSIPIDPEAELPLFPRAVLGLPIIFHFAPGDGQKTGDRLSPTKDPADATITPIVMNANGQQVAAERLASPVIARPVRIGRNWYAGVLIVRTSQLMNLMLHYQGVGVDHSKATVENSLTINAERVQGPHVSALSKGPIAGFTDALSAFENSLISGKFRT